MQYCSIVARTKRVQTRSSMKHGMVVVSLMKSNSSFGVQLSDRDCGTAYQKYCDFMVEIILLMLCGLGNTQDADSLTSECAASYSLSLCKETLMS